MFTGLIQDLGRLSAVLPQEGSTRLTIATGLPLGEIREGESIAVDGVCLTVTGFDGGAFQADVIPETLERTTLGTVQPGARLNLERSLRFGDRLGGHLVQGHVDGMGRVAEVIDEAGAGYRVWIELAPALAPLVAFKGSIAVNGVSLTVSDLRGERFEVALIPETLARTNLGTTAAGDRVNLEVDLMARYLLRMLESRGGLGSSTG